MQLKNELAITKSPENFAILKWFPFMYYQGKKAIFLEKCYALYEQICLIPLASCNFRYFLTQFFKNSPNTLDHAYITVNY